MQSNHDDYETLKPHSDIHQDRNDKDEPQLLAAPFKPENLRHQHIATDHEEPRPLIRSESAVEKMEPLVRIAAVPGDKELHRVGISDN